MPLNFLYSDTKSLSESELKFHKNVTTTLTRGDFSLQ